MLELFGIQLGTPFQGGTFLTALVILFGLIIRNRPRLRELGIGAEAQLRKELKECRDDCDEKTDKLRHELWAAKAESLQRWHSFYLALPANAKTPEMETMIERIQHVQQIMGAQEPKPSGEAGKE